MDDDRVIRLKNLARGHLHPLDKETLVNGIELIRELQEENRQLQEENRKMKVIRDSIIGGLKRTLKIKSPSKIEYKSIQK